MISADDARKKLLEKSGKRVSADMRISKSLRVKFKTACTKEGLAASDVLEDLIQQSNKIFEEQKEIKAQMLGFTDRSTSSFFILERDWKTFQKNCKKRGFRIGYLVEFIITDYIRQIEERHKTKIKE